MYYSVAESQLGKNLKIIYTEKKFQKTLFIKKKYILSDRYRKR